MRHLLLFVLMIPAVVCAQAPATYYQDAMTKTGDELKAALNTIIKGHTRYSYTSSSTDVWNILQESDRDPANSANVILLYSGLSVNAAQEYNNANGWTREHVWAKSRGDFGTALGAGTDCHHLRPENDNINSTRSNLYFDEGGSEVYYDNVFTGCYKNSSRKTFEPRDAVKGDVARMIFYMAVRYEGDGVEPDLELTESIFEDSDKRPLMGVKSTLLKWNTQDPVDDFERNRNEVVYKYQNNRNPFIDHPEYGNLIWGSGHSAAVSSNIADEYTVLLADGYLNITSSHPINIVAIHSITGQLLMTMNGNGALSMTVGVSQLPSGICIVVVNGVKAFKVVR